MDAQKHLEEMKDIQESIYNFIKETPETDALDKMQKYLIDPIIANDRIKMNSILHFISIIANNYHRYPTFFDKIEQIINLIKDQIRNKFDNYEIFTIFRKNKRLLLFLFEEKIILPSKEIATTFTFKKFQSQKFPHYFWPEFESIFNPEFREQIKQEIDEVGFGDLESFNQKRKKGENDNFICQLIQNDSIDDFIVHLNQKDLSPLTTVNNSIFETNPFLLKKQQTTLFEYSLFYGSIRIFNYLFLKLGSFYDPDKSIIYAIHSNNPELFCRLEESKSKPESYDKCFQESIKCHHNEIATYIQNNLIEPDNNTHLLTYINYYNFGFIQNCNQINFNSYFLNIKNVSVYELLFDELGIKLNMNDEILYYVSNGNNDNNDNDEYFKMYKISFFFL